MTLFDLSKKRQTQIKSSILGNPSALAPWQCERLKTLEDYNNADWCSESDRRCSRAVAHAEGVKLGNKVNH